MGAAELPEHARRNRERWDALAPEYRERVRDRWATDEPAWGIWDALLSLVGRTARC